MKITANKIEMSRGGSETLTVPLDDETGPVALVTGDSVKFTVRRTASDTVKNISKTVTAFTNGLAFITIRPADTATMEFGWYVYDVEVTFVNGDVKTIVVGPFIVSEEVTYA